MNAEHLDRYDLEFSIIENTPLTDALINKNPELEKKKVKINTRDSFEPEQPTTILLPGIVISPDMAFRRQEEKLSELGQNVAMVEYVGEGFSQELLQVQVFDFMHSLRQDQKVNFVGMSIGARAVIGTLADMPDDLQQRVDGVVLLGLVYSDLDLKSDMFGRLSHVANRITPDQFYTRMSGLIKSKIKIDPMYLRNADDERIVKSQVDDLLPVVIADMFSELANSKPVGDIEPLNHGIKAGIGWWEDDHASKSARQRATKLFKESYEFSISGHHGWTETGTEDINDAISKLVQ